MGRYPAKFRAFALNCCPALLQILLSEVAPPQKVNHASPGHSQALPSQRSPLASVTFSGDYGDDIVVEIILIMLLTLALESPEK